MKTIKLMQETWDRLLASQQEVRGFYRQSDGLFVTPETLKISPDEPAPRIEVTREDVRGETLITKFIHTWQAEWYDDFTLKLVLVGEEQTGDKWVKE